MKGDETRKIKQNDKIRESIMSDKGDSKGVEDVSKNVYNPDDAAELIERIECIMKSKKTIF